MNRKIVVVALIAPILVGVALILYTWPSARSQPHDVAVGVVAGDRADSVVGRLQDQGGAFNPTRIDSEAAARTAIEDRHIDAAVITAPTPKVLVASAAGPALAMQITPMLTKVAGSGATVEDVVATPSTDPMGAVLGQGVLPLTLAGQLSGILLALTLRPGKRQLGMVAFVSVVSGVLAWAVTGAWLDVLGPAPWWLESGAFAFTVLAVGAIVLGLHAVLGRAGLPIAFGLLVFVGNAFAGTSSAPELLPDVPHRIGQWLPPGAGNELLRSVAFFHGHGSTHSIVVLGVWSVAGILAVLVGRSLAVRRASAGKHEAGHGTPAALQHASDG